MPSVLGGLIIDTVELRETADMGADAAHELAALWEAPPDAEAPVVIAGRLLGPALRVRVAARGSAAPLMLAGPHWRLMLSPWSGYVRLILGACYLATTSPLDVVAECERIAHVLGLPGWRVARADVAADTTGVPLDRYADHGACVRRLRGASSHADESDTEAWRGRQLETVTLGRASSPLQMCLYRKDIELRKRSKAWQEADLRERGWDGVKPVVRIEARFRGRILRELQGVDGESLHAWMLDDETMRAAWAYATRAVRYCIPSMDKNRARWQTADDWQTLADLGTTAPRRRRTPGVAARDERRIRASRDIVRGFVALAAEPEYYDCVIDGLRRHVDAGHAPELALMASVCARVGDLLGIRALGERDSSARLYELRARMLRRARLVGWMDDPSMPMVCV